MFLLIALCAASPMAACAQDKDTDATKLQGQWTLTASSRGDKGNLLVFDGKRFRGHNNSGEVETEGTFVVRSGKAPKEIDLVVERKGIEYTMRGIYVLDSDTLKMAYHAVRENSMRPTDFKGGQDIRIFVCERGKAK